MTTQSAQGEAETAQTQQPDQQSRYRPEGHDQDRREHHEADRRYGFYHHVILSPETV